MKHLFFSLVILSVFLSACQSRQKQGINSSGEKYLVTDTAATSTCPFLTKDRQGNFVASFILQRDTTAPVVCYAVLGNGDQAFGSAKEITPSKGAYPHGENMPKIVFAPGGEVVVVWGILNKDPRNPYAGLVYYSGSTDQGISWSPAKPLVTDTSSYDQRYFSVAVLPNQKVGIAWLDNRGKTDREGSTLYFASMSGGRFDSERPIGKTCCPCCRTGLFVDQKNNIHVIYRKIIQDSIRDMAHQVSFDGGQTFSESTRISPDNWVIDGCPHTGPSMAENTSGLHFAWYTGGKYTGVFYCNSSDGGKTFSTRSAVSNSPTARHPQIISLPDNRLVIVWDEVVNKEENYHSWIGFQLRSPGGAILKTSYITPKNENSEFPVIEPIDSNHVLVVYDRVVNNKSRIMYQTVGIE